ncbi:MAG: hypothetical protein P4L84_00740 [Isosphaeraceae bacterium]|nr:hypothetical protein [Isosphaeraceae bacterium]
MDPSRKTAFVTVLEPNGVLEPQVLLLAESLRRFGGRLASCPFFCVSPRFRPPLRRSTRARFDELGIVPIDRNFRHKYAWFPFTPKPLAMAAARDVSDATHLVWLDADVLILDEPDAFLGADGADFAACPSGRDIATSGPADRFHSYWEQVCGLFGLDVEDLPWVETHHEGLQVRFYMNGGVFRVRRESAVIEHVLRNFEALMDSGLSTSTDSFWQNDMVALAAAPFTSGSSWCVLPRCYNFSVSGVPERDQLQGFESARVLHYHLALSPANRERLLSYFREFRPDRLEWLEAKGALDASGATPAQRVVRRVLRASRERAMRRYLAGCRVVDTGARAEPAAILP